MTHDRNEHRRRKRRIALRILAVPVFLFLGAWVFQMLWNFAAPAAFSGGILDYWQAMALIIAARILVGMPGRAFGGRRPPRFHNREEWKSRMRENYGPGGRYGRRFEGRPHGPRGGRQGRPGDAASADEAETDGSD